MTNPNPVLAAPDDKAERPKPCRDERVVRRRQLIYAALILLASLSGQPHAAPSNLPGTLANPGFEGQAITSAYFFAGQGGRAWRPPKMPGRVHDFVIQGPTA